MFGHPKQFSDLWKLHLSHSSVHILVSVLFASSVSGAIMSFADEIMMLISTSHT